MNSYNLTHLKQLEAESIHVIREVAAEFKKPVMLYSVGKDSAVMTHLALKAFYPAKPPFPFLHVDTTWKFREMIEFRDSYVKKELGIELLVNINQEASTGLMRPSGVLDGTKKNREPKSECSRFAISSIVGILRTSGQNCGTSTTAGSTLKRASACFLSRTGPNWIFGNTSI